MTPRWVAPFLASLADTGIVSEACRAAGVSTTAAYALRKSNDDFSAAWEQAMEDSMDVAEAELRRRAIRGVQEPVVYQGQLTPVWEYHDDGSPVLEAYEVPGKDGETQTHYRNVQKRDANGQPVWLTITRYSDPLLALLLKGRRKKVFAERTELTGADGADLGTKTLDPTQRAARVAAILARAKDRQADAQAAKDFGDIA